MMKQFVLICVGIMYFSCLCSAQSEKDKQASKEPPPSVVSVSEIIQGQVQPISEFVGTVFYTQVSEVASEVAGRVEKVNFEEGERVKEGQELVVLNTDLLDTEIKGTNAAYEQALIEIEKAKKDFGRIANLYKQESIAESVYDEYRFKTKELEKKAAALKAELDRQRLEKRKKIIKAPFNGIIIDKPLEKGEWVSVGSKVAVVAKDDEVDVVINVPEHILGYLEKGLSVRIKNRGRELTGSFNSFIPKGDVATRTFSVKIRLENTAELVEGMEASALLPSGEAIEGLLVSRDAVISKFGKDVIFVVEDESKAKMIPVMIMGYQDMMVGVSGQGLEPGMKAVVKGNERIRDGQPVRIIEK